MSGEKSREDWDGISSSINNNSIEKEDDDIFDRVLFLEEEILESSLKEGYIAGLHKGRRDGIAMGERYGRSVGEEIGFYIGFVNTWLSLTQVDELHERKDQEPPTDSEVELTSVVKRVTKGRASSSSMIEMLTKFKGLLESIPLHEPENPLRDELLTSARSRFRAIIARLGLSQAAAGTKKIDTLNF